jgi:hypothetical protein
MLCALSRFPGIEVLPELLKREEKAARMAQM